MNNFKSESKEVIYFKVAVTKLAKHLEKYSQIFSFPITDMEILKYMPLFKFIRRCQLSTKISFNDYDEPSRSATRK